jgi:hypothetical protein
MDRIAELCVRHHAGEYDGTSVRRRLDALFAAPLDQMEKTKAALLKACDFLQIDGSQLDAMNAEADRRAAAHNPSCTESTPAEAS